MMIAARFLALLMSAAAANQLPPPTEIAANAIFRDAFIAVMEQEPGSGSFNGHDRGGPAPTGRPPHAWEEMT